MCQAASINSGTNLDDVICDCIYLRPNKRERRPSDPNRNFKPGEFAKLVQKALNTVDLIFSNGIDWQSFLQSFQDLQVEGANGELAIQAIERKTGGAFVVRVEVPPDANKAEIEESFWQKYRPILQAKDEQLALYGQILEDKRKENTKLLNIVETMAIKEDESLNEVQVKILQSIANDVSDEREISKNLQIKRPLVRYYLQYFEDNGFINAYGKGYRDLDDPILEYIDCQLTDKGKVAADNPNNLIKESTMSREVNYNLQNSKFGGGFAAEGGTQLGGTFNDYSITIGQNIDDIECLIASLRETIQQFPEEQREDAEMEIDDLEAEIVNPEKQDPKRFGRRLKRLAAIGTTVATLAGGAVKLSENANTFTDNVVELGEKLEVPVEIIKDRL